MDLRPELASVNESRQFRPNPGNQRSSVPRRASVAPAAPDSHSTRLPAEQRVRSASGTSPERDRSLECLHRQTSTDI